MTTNSLRFFKLLSIPDTLRQFVEENNDTEINKRLDIYKHLPTLRYSGRALNDAAYLTFCNIVSDMEHYNIPITGELQFSLRESTRGCDHKVYEFIGTIESIQNHKKHVKCGTCIMCTCRKLNMQSHECDSKYDESCDNGRFVTCEKLFTIKSIDNDETTSYLFSN